ncbi:membrane-bound lytic murein transglycosylase MltF [Vibrio vulnificus]|nr:membrane-bound lytic murein transglycosylase MltF [Vibrio vulnificus]ELP5728361.1 membrane-bound lytic murein transglycosylase MltF [Vibrio vulnificus]ELX4137696.1 membrane-bound lytic murein transglycosylase MltF [Vibrio vulnificus]ELX4140231.1 membrane-bound lytic murein transglycosylase MltF [Vibrio vulnificus]
MPILNLHQLRNALFILATSIFLAGCQIESKPTSELDQIKQRGVLRVGTLNNQLSYYIGPDGQAGLDYELARQFADELGVRLEIKTAFRQSELFPMLKRGDIDLVATGLSQTPRVIKQFRPGPSYYYVSQVVVYKNGALRPRNLNQLIEYQNAKTKSDGEESNELAAAQTLQVVKQSQNVTLLKSLQNEYPELKYTTVSDADNYDLLRRVSAGELRFAISDSIELSLAQRLYPDLATAFEITEDQPASWFVRRSPDESLYALMIEFFGDISQSGELARLEEKYIGHIGTFDYVDTRAFIRALDSKLPQWAPLFEQYSAEFDWRLIAALAYQESHWNPLAKSPTGVRGMMMLTLPTAQSVGVKNRLDPEQSIRGGVEYLRRIVARVPESIPQHEKIWFALASYNVGFGHMMDARRLTKKQGADPDSWGDVKERLPLLRQKKYFSQTRYGYARGDEAKNYVENIRRYYQSIIGHVGQNSLIASDQEGEIQVIPPLENEELAAVNDAVESATGSLEHDTVVSQAESNIPTNQ